MATIHYTMKNVKSGYQNIYLGKNNFTYIYLDDLDSSKYKINELWKKVSYF